MEFASAAESGRLEGLLKELETDSKSAHDYWKEFASNPRKGMSYEEFERGYRSADPSADDKDIWEAFSEADSDRSKHLSWKEFERLFKERSSHERPPEEFEAAI
jgi:Ca2+-binding EF-hand superfamily protein